MAAAERRRQLGEPAPVGASVWVGAAVTVGAPVGAYVSVVGA